MTRGEALEILGLDSDASLDEAREAYRTLVKHYHPDKNAASNASVMFRIIQNAWEVIQDHSEQELAKAETRWKQAESETARKRTEVESRWKRTKASYIEESLLGQILGYFFSLPPVQGKSEKNIKRFCYLFHIVFYVGVIVPEMITDLSVLTFQFIFDVFLYSILCFLSGWMWGWIVIGIKRLFK